MPERKTPKRKTPKRKTLTRKNQSFDPLMNAVKNDPVALAKLKEYKQKNPTKYEEGKNKAACIIQCRSKNKEFKSLLKCMTSCNI